MSHSLSDLNVWRSSICVEKDSGLFFATSKEEPALFVVAPDLATLDILVDEAIKEIFSKRTSNKVSLMRPELEDGATQEVVIVETASEKTYVTH